MPVAKKQPSKVELIAHLRETYLFSSLDEDVLQDLAEDLTWISLKPGENLFRQGDDSDSTYLVVDGLLKVAIARMDGSEMFVGENKPGELIGEMGLFTGQSRTASIYADTESSAEVVKIPESGFRRMASANPSVWAHVGETIRQRLHRNQ